MEIGKLLPGAHGNVRGTFVKVQSNGCSGILKRPLQQHYPLEVRSAENVNSVSPTSDDTPQSDMFPNAAGEPEAKTPGVSLCSKQQQDVG